jgi:hypothetical protein
VVSIHGILLSLCSLCNKHLTTDWKGWIITYTNWYDVTLKNCISSYNLLEYLLLFHSYKHKMPLPILCERGGGCIKLSQRPGFNAKFMHTGYDVNGNRCLSKYLSSPLSVTILHFNLSWPQIILTGHPTELTSNLVCYWNLISEATFDWIMYSAILHTSWDVHDGSSDGQTNCNSRTLFKKSNLIKVTVAMMTHTHDIWHGEEYPLNTCTVMPSPAYHYYKRDLFSLINTWSVNWWSANMVHPHLYLLSFIYSFCHTCHLL